MPADETPGGPDSRLLCDHFPRANQYNPEWVVAGVSGGANPLWLAEWLCSVLELRPGMRVLDLGCGRAMSSIFLRREFGVEVWATDLWFSALENLQRIRDADVGDGVFPISADARSLPFADEFFDAVVSIDSFPYYGTDDHYMSYLARFVKPGGVIGIAGAGLIHELEGPIPEHLRTWWEPEMWCFHSANWWQRHWEHSGLLDVEVCDTMPEGWKRWLEWHAVIAPGNRVEIEALEADQGKSLGYVRVVGRRRPGVKVEERVTSVKTSYVRQPVPRGSE